MSNFIKPNPNRREFIKDSSLILGASALAGVALPHVHCAEDNTVKIALVGCGGRGTGAASNALSVSAQHGPVKMTSMVDVFKERLDGSFGSLQRGFADKMDVPDSRKYIGFDGYKEGMATLRKGDIVILGTPPAFRWVQFKHAIELGLNVFMEKPICVDVASGRKMIELADAANKKGLKVGVGLMVRHCRGRQALFNKIKEGAIGDIIAMRAYRMHPPVGSAFSGKKPDGISELMYQIKRFHSFLWASGGLFSDFYIHQIDECCWMKDAWPVKCHAIGGRHYRGDNIDQNFDNYQVEYTFEDGTKFFFYGRTMAGMKDEFTSAIHGTKGMTTVSLGGHHMGRACRIFKGHNMKIEDKVWDPPLNPPDPYQLEWDDLLDAVRNNKPYNEVKRAARASMVTTMGRYAAHTGQEISWDDYSKLPQEFAPNVDKLTLDGPAPILADKDGKYPIPMPGIKRDSEY